MCRAATCTICGKTTWAGCGRHIDDVKRSVPAGRWCPGHDASAEPAAATPQRAGFFARLFGR
ncbi:hypothetical protein [Sediminivirga luteola]|jgi:hypothetical protein|uniref:hypothetical protein n=1 Tax=Sediminivirga luteola TaxID=1774748 RepID=UPI001F5AC085|nr:hypothetical protein [Sediminivirga luteola]MCI2266882.1 hypothetical protein [Sediminivirga luteola]